MTSSFNAGFVQGLNAELHNLLLSFTEPVTINEALEQITKAGQPNFFKLIQVIRTPQQFVQPTPVYQGPSVEQINAIQRTEQQWIQILRELDVTEIKIVSKILLKGKDCMSNGNILYMELKSAGKMNLLVETLCNMGKQSLLMPPAQSVQSVQPVHCAGWNRSKARWEQIFKQLQWGDVLTVSHLELNQRSFGGNPTLLLNALLDAGKTEAELERLICTSLGKPNIMNC